jgi:Fe-S-cluster containining protein
MIASIELLTHDNLSNDVRNYLPTAEANAQKNLAKAELVNGKAIFETLAQTTNSHLGSAPFHQKLRRMRHLAAEFSDEFTPDSACKNGCSHCCNKGALVPKSEAKLMALCIDTPLVKQVATFRSSGSIETTPHLGTPCTFLVGGRCSIYEHRPLVCRMQINMDSDERLCKLVPNVQVPAPLLNSVNFQMFHADLIAKNNLVDIRNWFPNGLAS